MHGGMAPGAGDRRRGDRAGSAGPLTSTDLTFLPAGITSVCPRFFAAWLDILAAGAGRVLGGALHMWGVRAARGCYGSARRAGTDEAGASRGGGAGSDGAAGCASCLGCDRGGRVE
jgi:hypothetical protein